jgi:hypothetical protein
MAAIVRNLYLGSETMAVARQGCLRNEAYDRANREARLLLSAEGPGRSFRDVLERLDRVVADGRRELAARRVPARDIEAWDTSCRIMFLLIAWRP